jgi:hypothetical protein
MTGNNTHPSTWLYYLSCTVLLLLLLLFLFLLLLLLYGLHVPLIPRLMNPSPSPSYRMEKVASSYIISMRVCAASDSLTMNVLAIDLFLILLSGTFHFLSCL